MKTIKRFFWNAALLSATSILMRAVSVSFNVYVSSKIGAEGMGLFTLVMSVYTFAVTFATSGIGLAVTRSVTERVLAHDDPPPERRKKLGAFLRAAMSYALLFGGLGSVGLYTLAPFLGTRVLADARTVLSLKVLSFSLVPIAMTSVLNGYFNGVRRVSKNAATQLIEQFVKIGLTSAGLILLLPRGLEYGCVAVVGGASIAEGASLLTSYLFYRHDLRRHFPEKPRERGDAPAAFRFIASIALPVAFSSYLRSGLVTLEHLLIPWGLRRSGDSYEASLASYGTLHGMVFPLIMFPSAVLGAFSGLLIPEVSESHERGHKNRIRYIAGRVFSVSLMFSVGVSVILLFFGRGIGRTLYGGDAGDFIVLLAPLIPVMYLDSAVDSILKGMGEQLTSMKINLLDAAVSVAIVFFLTPRIGIMGYVTALFVCEMMNAALSIFRLVKITDVRLKVGTWLLRPFLCAFVAAVGAKFLMEVLPFLIGRVPGGALHLWCSVAVAGVLYLLLLLVTKTLSKADLAWFRGALTK